MKRLLFLFLFIPFETVWGQSAVGLPIYRCDNRVDARSCNSGCRLVDNFTIEFKVNSSNNVVIKNEYRKNILIISRPLSGDCKVVDSKNWVCTDPKFIESLDPKWKPEYVEAMTNGKYFQLLEIGGPGLKVFNCTR